MVCSGLRPTRSIVLKDQRHRDLVRNPGHKRARRAVGLVSTEIVRLSMVDITTVSRVELPGYPRGP